MHTQSIQKILEERRHLWGKGGKAKDSQESMKNKKKKSEKRIEEGNNLMFNNVSKTL